MEFVIKGRLTLERVTFYVSAKTLEGALARAVNGDFANVSSLWGACGTLAGTTNFSACSGGQYEYKTKNRDCSRF